MLQVKNLTVKIGEKEVLSDINFEIADGETFILFGPNGSGKTSLLMSLMGFAGYNIVKGEIIFRGQNITNMPMYERARLGMAMSFQRPPTIHGLKTRDFVKLCARGREIDEEALAKKVNMVEFLDRDVNAGFSGGEIKRSELLQLMAQNPHLLLFDEPESGVDLENMKLVGSTVRDLLHGQSEPACSKHCSYIQADKPKAASGLIITHTGYILEYVNADKAKVLYNGRLCCQANPRDILEQVSKFGYQECLRCFN